jgi:hypothetical protein
MLNVAAGCRGDAAVGVGAANEFNFGKDAGARDGSGFEEKPWDRVRFGGGALLEKFSLDGAAVFGFPDWAGTVGACGFTVCVSERGLGRLEDPLRAGGGLLAGVDLHAFAGNCQDDVLGFWGVCGILGGCGGGDGERRDEYQQNRSAVCHGGILRSGFASLNERNGVCGFTAGGRILE